MSIESVVSSYPSVTVCIPTFRRPEALVRAVESALNQDYPETTVLVSDDGPAAPDGTRSLRERFGDDSRLRIIRNEGQPGFIGNTNNSLLAGTGEWLKILHDDDILEPECLKNLMEGARAYPEARLIRCRVDHYYNGRLIKKYDPGDQPTYRCVFPSEMTRSAYLLRDVGEAIPTAQCVHRSAVEAGILFQTFNDMPLMAESCWNIRLYRHAPVLLVNRALAQWHQGLHETMTSGTDLDDLDRQFIAFRRFSYQYVDGRDEIPPVEAAEDFVRMLRALARLKRGHIGAFLRNMLAVRHAGAFPLLAQHLLGKRI